MEIGVRDVKAACECGSTEFLAPARMPLGASDTLICARCARATPYLTLLDQIGEKAIRQAREALDALRRKQGD